MTHYCFWAILCVQVVQGKDKPDKVTHKRVKVFKHLCGWGCAIFCSYKDDKVASDKLKVF